MRLRGPADSSWRRYAIRMSGTASNTAPPTFSKQTSMPFGQAAARPAARSDAWWSTQSSKQKCRALMHQPTGDQVRNHVIRRRPVAGEDDRCPGNHQQSPKDFSPRAMITGSLLAPSTLLLPVDDAGRQDARSPGGAATPRLRERGTARGRREPLGLMRLLRLLQPEDRLALGEGDPCRTASGGLPLGTASRPAQPRTRRRGPVLEPCGSRIARTEREPRRLSSRPALS